MIPLGLSATSPICQESSGNAESNGSVPEEVHSNGWAGGRDGREDMILPIVFAWVGWSCYRWRVCHNQATARWRSPPPSQIGPQIRTYQIACSAPFAFWMAPPTMSPSPYSV